jgi:hypothetical protein
MQDNFVRLSSAESSTVFEEPVPKIDSKVENIVSFPKPSPSPSPQPRIESPPSTAAAAPQSAVSVPANSGMRRTESSRIVSEASKAPINKPPKNPSNSSLIVNQYASARPETDPRVSLHVNSDLLASGSIQLQNERMISDVIDEEGLEELEYYSEQRPQTATRASAKNQPSWGALMQSQIGVGSSISFLGTLASGSLPPLKDIIVHESERAISQIAGNIKV